ncbi:MAG: hypothetical protein ATN35_05300 [Epulopiscium sp. Nele67-Bin004]|nr:MAG: hypothetical protein ATN35_05300 [Epulopiscium sp. Nele67-Bin004]
MKKLLAGVLAATTVLGTGAVYATTADVPAQKPVREEAAGERLTPEEHLAKLADELGLTIEEVQAEMEAKKAEREANGEAGPKGPQGERPEGERPEGERPEGERPEGERPEHVEGEAPAGERHHAPAPTGERHHAPAPTEEQLAEKAAELGVTVDELLAGMEAKKGEKEAK